MSENRTLAISEIAFQLIKKHGSERTPVTGQEIAQLMAHELSSGLGPASTELVRVERYIHRRKVP